jgi:hypothetical protein
VRKVRDSYRHAARRIERKILEPERSVQRAHAVIQWMRQHTEAADLARQAHRRAERKDHQ